MELPARVSFSQATLCASQRSAFVSPRVPQSSSALPALCGDTDGSGAAAAAAAAEQQHRSSSSGAAPEQQQRQQQQQQRLSGVGPAGGTPERARSEPGGDNNNIPKEHQAAGAAHTALSES